MTEKPTRQQAKVLKAIQNQMADMQRTVDRAEQQYDQSGESPTPGWHNNIHSRGRRHEELERAAAAAGVPQAWIEQVRVRGEHRLAWKAALHWREPEPIDRQTLLDRLGDQFRQVQDMAAVAAAYGEQAAQLDPAAAALFDGRLWMLGQRAAAIAAVLKVSSTEADQLWGDHTFTAAADSVRAAAPHALAWRWHDHTHSDITDLALQATVLSAAGITGDLARVPAPTPPEMVQRIPEILARDPVPAAATEGGHSIATAVDATGVTSGQQAEFDSGTPTPPVHSPAPVHGIEP
ncbi:hypothetical protein [Nocardia mexicana]|uniref:Uncharacterized protein n=1 Tax=Nocardia mexicana TaxID=279262 RepID=A0A370GK26_9NOCA|nr:hypothetical protein [Nocardia mexicana]RDI43576.1 hypothetical protein DFR68_12043 [Nocardia mexicana]